MGGFLGFERSLNAVMVAADTDPRDQKISGRELRALKREDVVYALLHFVEHEKGSGSVEAEHSSQ